MQKKSAAERIYGGFTVGNIRRLIYRAVIFPVDFARRFRRSAAAEGSSRPFIPYGLPSSKLTEFDVRQVGCSRRTCYYTTRASLRLGRRRNWMPTVRVVLSLIDWRPVVITFVDSLRLASAVVMGFSLKCYSCY